MSVRSTLLAVVVGLLLTGCTTSIAGEPAYDSSAVPRPQTGSFATAPRDLRPPSARDGQIAEALRMIERMPLQLEVDPALHYGSSVSLAGTDSGRVLSTEFGEVAGRRLSTAQLGVTIGASSAPTSQRASVTTRARSAIVGLLRMASPDAASSAVAKELLGRDPVFAGVTPPDKKEASIPGYPRAVAYTADWGGGVNPLSAFLAIGQYVVAVRGDFDSGQVSRFFGLQAKALEGFTPTPIGELTSLPLDSSGLARFTLPSQDKSQGYSAPIRAMLPWQTDIAHAQTVFSAEGVDQFARGGSTLYRARDAKSARNVVDAFVKETTDNNTQAQVSGVSGVPGGKCVTYARVSGSETKSTYCVGNADRYVIEFAAAQQQLAEQGLGAAYLVAQFAK